MRYLICFWLCLLAGSSWGQDGLSAKADPYTLADFLIYNPDLAHRVDELFAELDDSQRVAQLIVPAIGRLGKPTKHIRGLVQRQRIGGLLLLNGTREQFSAWVQEFDSTLLAAGGLPLLYSADAEPSLINRKIIGSTTVPVTSSIKTIADNEAIARTISQDLLEIGIRHNYAPVTDVSTANRAIGNRAYSASADTVQQMNASFIASSQAMGVAATAKHFPGHGLVKGDSHKQLVYINDSLEELGNYPPLIAAGVASVMVGHIAIRGHPDYDTEGLPASLSRRLITGLLKEELGFRGLVVTDAMNMQAVSALERAEILALRAGVDQILMAAGDEEALLADIIMEMYLDKAFKRQVYVSVKKVIRLKLCLGIIR